MFDVFHGSISDMEIVKQSGLLQKLDEVGLILLDRGFTMIRDIKHSQNILYKCGMGQFLVKKGKCKRAKCRCILFMKLICSMQFLAFQIGLSQI